MNYVYYFTNYKNDIIYVGKTSNLRRRMRQHFLNGHLPEKCYMQINKIFVSKTSNSKYDTEICETLLIDKYKPVYNKDKKFNEKFEKTQYVLPKLNFVELYYDFILNEISFTPIKQKCFTECSLNVRSKALIDYNIMLLEKRRELVGDILTRISNLNELIEDIENLYRKSYEIIEFDCSSLDEPISENGDFDEVYIGFNKLNLSKEISSEKIEKIAKYGFIFKIDDNHYGIPLLGEKILKNINKINV